MNADPELVFIDMNVLVYAYDRSAGKKQAIAAGLIEQCWEDMNGCLSIQVLQEFHVVVSGKITPPLDHLVARQIVADLSRWRLHLPDASDLLQAIDLARQLRLSFWDAMILQSALRLGCRRILTEDLSNGQTYGSLQVINPFL